MHYFLIRGFWDIHKILYIYMHMIKIVIWNLINMHYNITISVISNNL